MAMPKNAKMQNDGLANSSKDGSSGGEISPPEEIDHGVEQGQGQANTPDPPFPQPNEEIVRQFLDIQKRELEIKSKELSQKTNEHELDKLRDKNQYDFACKALEANAKDRSDSRQAKSGLANKFLVGLVIVVFLILSFLSFALYLDKDEAVKKIIEAAILLISGFTSGWGIGYMFGKKTAKSDSNSNSQKSES